MTAKESDSEEAIFPDEIIDTNEFNSSTSENLQNIQSLKAFCNERPWLRLVSLGLAIVTFFLSFIILGVYGVTVLLAAFSLFENEGSNKLMQKALAFYKHSLATALSLFIGFFSPIFGIGIAFIYIILSIDESATLDSLISKYTPKE